MSNIDSVSVKKAFRLLFEKVENVKTVVSLFRICVLVILYSCTVETTSGIGVEYEYVLYKDDCGVTVFENFRDTIQDTVKIGYSVINEGAVASSILYPLPFSAYENDSLLMGRYKAFGIGVSVPHCVEGCPELKTKYHLSGAVSIRDTMIKGEIRIPINSDSIQIGNGGSAISIEGDSLSGFAICND